MASARAIIAAAASQAGDVDRIDDQSTSGNLLQNNGRHLCIKQLAPRIGRMSFGEVPRFIQHVVWLQDVDLLTPGHRAVLQQALRRRMAELFSVTPLHELAIAGDAVSMLETQVVGSRCDALRRALEARLAYLLYHPQGGHERDSSLKDLCEHHACAADLVQRRLIAPAASANSVAHLRHWLERATLAQLGEHANMVGTLMLEEPLLRASVAARMQHVAGRLMSLERLDRFLHVLLDLDGQGLQIFTDRLESALQEQVRSGLQVWSPLQLQRHLEPTTSGLLRLCRSNDAFRQHFGALLAARVAQAISVASRSLKHVEDVPRVQAELADWARLGRCGMAAGLLSLAPDERHAILDAVTSCTARCMGSPMFRSSMKEVQDLEWGMVVFVGGQTP